MKVNVSEIVNRVDLKSAIEQYTGGRFNRNGFISCPFHVDREPSLSVKRERFHCFSCDRGGDVIDFTQTYFNLDFRAASKKLSIDFNLGLNIECREKEKTEEPDFWTKVISEHDEKRKRHIQEIIAKKKEERESIEKKIRMIIIKQPTDWEAVHRLEDEVDRIVDAIRYLRNVLVL